MILALLIAAATALTAAVIVAPVPIAVSTVVLCYVLIVVAVHRLD